MNYLFFILNLSVLDLAFLTNVGVLKFLVDVVMCAKYYWWHCFNILHTPYLRPLIYIYHTFLRFFLCITTLKTNKYIEFYHYEINFTLILWPLKIFGEGDFFTKKNYHYFYLKQPKISGDIPRC